MDHAADPKYLDLIADNNKGQQQQQHWATLRFGSFLKESHLLEVGSSLE